MTQTSTVSLEWVQPTNMGTTHSHKNDGSLSSSVISFEIPVYQLVNRRRFQQIEVLEGQNILVTLSGKKDKIRVYYLSYLKSKIMKSNEVSEWLLYVQLIWSGFVFKFQKELTRVKCRDLNKLMCKIFLKIIF